MDEIKLKQWKERFKQNIRSLKIEYDAFLLSRPFYATFVIHLDAADQWELEMRDDLPEPIKKRMQQIFLDAKPEDSI